MHQEPDTRNLEQEVLKLTLQQLHDFASFDNPSIWD